MIALEFTQTVGWHAHLLICAPEHLGPEDTALMLEKLWLHQFRGFLSKDFEDRLFWSEQPHGDYFSYSTKHLSRGSEIDVMNIVQLAT